MASLAFSQSFEGLPSEIGRFVEQMNEPIPPTSGSVARSLCKIATKLLATPESLYPQYDSVNLIDALNIAWTLNSCVDVENQVWQVLLAYLGVKALSAGREAVYAAASIFVPRAIECLTAHPNEPAAAFIDVVFSGPGKVWLAAWLKDAVKAGDDAGGGLGGGNCARFVDMCAALPLCSDAGTTQSILLALFRLLRAGIKVPGATKRLEASLEGPLELSVVRTLAKGDSFRDNVRRAGLALGKRVPKALEYQNERRLVKDAPLPTSALVPLMAGYVAFTSRVMQRVDADVDVPVRFGGFAQQVNISVLGIGAFLVNPPQGSTLNNLLANAAAGQTLVDDWLTRSETEALDAPIPHEYTLWPWSAIKTLQGRDGYLEMLPAVDGGVTIRFELKDAKTLWEALKEAATVRPASIDIVWLPPTKFPPPVPEASIAAEAYEAALRPASPVRAVLDRVHPQSPFDSQRTVPEMSDY